MPAWGQSLFGEVLTINSIRMKLSDAADKNDKIAKYYWYGRIADIAINFEPIAAKEDDLRHIEIGGNKDNTRPKLLSSHSL